MREKTNDPWRNWRNDIACAVLAKEPEKNNNGALVAASVLVAIGAKHDIPFVFLIKRAPTLAYHGGQIAFPGGKNEQGESASQAALREAGEEIGLPQENLKIAGFLDSCITGTGFTIIPVVGFITKDFLPILNRQEVCEIFAPSLQYLLTATQKPALFASDNDGVKTIQLQNQLIWGSTWRILHNLAEKLAIS